jgi:hypothetical protein
MKLSKKKVKAKWGQSKREPASKKPKASELKGNIKWQRRHSAQVNELSVMAKCSMYGMSLAVGVDANENGEMTSWLWELRVGASRRIEITALEMAFFYGIAWSGMQHDTFRRPSIQSSMKR